MTTIYFVRHAKPNYQNHNDRLRELTEKGLEDSRSVTAFLSDKKIDLILSSPYRRAIDTIKNFADKNEMPILIVDDSMISNLSAKASGKILISNFLAVKV